MKIRLFPSPLVISCAAVLAAATAGHGALIAAWTLDESSGNINSSAGSLPPGLATGVPAYSQPGVPAGNYGAIAVLTGGGTSIGLGPSAVDSFFTVGTTSQNAVMDLDRTGSFTVMSWINPSAPAAASTYRTVSTGSAASAGGGWGLGLRLNNVSGTGSTVRFTTYGIADTNSPVFDVVPGQWIHIASTYSNGSINYFLNGVQLGTGTTSLFNNDTADARLVIGGRLGGADADQLSGFVDGIRVYDSVLTAGEIAQAAADSLTVVPEPSVSASLLLAALGLTRRRRK